MSNFLQTIGVQLCCKIAQGGCWWEPVAPQDLMNNEVCTNSFVNLKYRRLPIPVDNILLEILLFSCNTAE
jgi:hypothetical protein